MLQADISVMLGVACNTSSIGADRHDWFFDIRQELDRDPEYRQEAEQHHDRRDDRHGSGIGKARSCQPHRNPPDPLVLWPRPKTSI
jgi:hypothetical protein